MTDREYFDVLRQRALDIAKKLTTRLDAPKAPDGMMSPHVAAAELIRAGAVGGELIALAELAAKHKSL